MHELTLRERLPADLPVLWRWIYAEAHPEWMQWDRPYFSAKPQPMPYADYLAMQDGKTLNPNRNIIVQKGLAGWSPTTRQHVYACRMCRHGPFGQRANRLRRAVQGRTQWPR